MGKKKINDTAICIKISKELKDKIDRDADKLGITTADYIRLILNRGWVIVDDKDKNSTITY